MGTNEVAKPTPKELEAAWAAIRGELELERTGDPEAMSLAILERIREADDFDAAFTEQKLDAWRDNLDRPALVQDVRLNRSGFEGGATVYAVVDLVWLDTGEEATVSCGGRNVMAQLVKMLEKGWTDRPVQMIARRTGDGNTALWLVKADPDAAKKAA